MDPYETPKVASEPIEPESAVVNINQVATADFGLRLGASIMDFIILYVCSIVFGIIFSSFYNQISIEYETLEIMGQVLGAIISWLYAALLESSRLKASWGKQMMNIQVSDLNGERISFARASGRHFAKYISALILCLGYFMIFWTVRKQTLHDKMAGCLVNKK